MILLILMQRPKQEGLGAAFGAGVTDQVFGARTTNVLQRGTVYLSTMFFFLSFVLAILIGHKNQKVSMINPKNPSAKVEAAKPAAPTPEPAAPKSLSKELPAEEGTTTPEIPAAPKEAPPLPMVPKDGAPDAPVVPKEVVPAPATPQDKVATPPEKSGQP